MFIKSRRVNKEAILPHYAHMGDAGLDLFSLESYLLKPNEKHQFAIGFALEIPDGFVGLIWDKSGLSFRHGLHCLGGVIDSTYRGEIKIMLMNFGQKPYKIEKGDKIAQLLVQPIVKAEIREEYELSDSLRKNKGFGSTGKK